MQRNAELSDPDVSRTLKNLPNGSQENVAGLRNTLFNQKIFQKRRERIGFSYGKLKKVVCDGMPQLETTPSEGGRSVVPVSPEMPKLVPFVFDKDDSKKNQDDCSSNSLNKENVDLSDPEISFKGMSSTTSAQRRKRGRPRKPDKDFSSVTQYDHRLLQPVVVLKRLPPEPTELTSEDESSNDSWSQWPEEYEGCSYDDFICDVESGEKYTTGSVENFPEVDMIDGVEFLSFLQERDVKKFALKNNQTIVFPSDASNADLDSCPEGMSMLKDDQAYIMPTKTRDITLIKGWKRKLFLDDNFTPNSMSPNYSAYDKEEDGSIDKLYSHSVDKELDVEGDNSLGKFSDISVAKYSDKYSDISTGDNNVGKTSDNSADQYDSVSDSDTKASVSSRTNRDKDSNREPMIDTRFIKTEPPSFPPEVELLFSDHEDQTDDNASSPWTFEDKVKIKTEGKPKPKFQFTEPVPDENLLKMCEQPDLYGKAKSAAFCSRSLDDFLTKHSTLQVNFLSECDPVVQFIPSSHPVLKVGKLKVEDKEEVRSRVSARVKSQMLSKASFYKKVSPVNPVHAKKHWGVPQDNKISLASASESASKSVSTEPKKKYSTEKPQAPVESRLVFPNDDSNSSSSSIVDAEPGSTWEPSSRSPGYSQDSSERRELYTDNALLFENEPGDEYEGQMGNFAIDEYDPMTCDEKTLEESKDGPLKIVNHTIWSTSDTAKEEKMLFDLLCELKSPDSYLISKIKFDDDTNDFLSEINSFLTEDDAVEVAKCVYGGYSSREEMVTRMKELVLVRKSRSDVQKMSQKIERAKKRKHEAQLKTVKDFVQWYRTGNSPDEDDAPHIQSWLQNRKRPSRRPLRYRDPSEADARSNKRGAFLIPKENVPQPHSPAIPLVFDDPKEIVISPAESPKSQEVQPSLSSASSSFSGFPSPVSSPAPQEVIEPIPIAEKNDEPSRASPAIADSSTNPISSPEVTSSTTERKKKSSDSSSPEIIKDTRRRRPKASSKVPRFKAPTRQSSSARKAAATKSKAHDSEDEVMVISPPKKNKKFSSSEESSHLRSSDRSGSPTSLTVESSNGVTTFTPNNLNAIRHIKMNLNSEVSLDQTAKRNIQSQPLPPMSRVPNLLRLIPLNEYQWKPPNCKLGQSPTIKSFIINTPNCDMNALLNKDTINMPLAAVATPAPPAANTNDSIYLLYGSIEMLSCQISEEMKSQEEDDPSKTAKGLSVRIGQQELFLSCSVELTKQPVRLHAIIGKTVAPLLVYVALNSSSKEHTSNVPSVVNQTNKIESPKTNPPCQVVASSPQEKPRYKLLPPPPPQKLAPSVLSACSATTPSNPPQHFKIVRKNNKLTVEKTTNPASSSVFPEPRPFGSIRNVLARPVQPVKPLPFATPTTTSTSTKGVTMVQNSSGVILLPMPPSSQPSSAKPLQPGTTVLQAVTANTTTTTINTKPILHSTKLLDCLRELKTNPSQGGSINKAVSEYLKGAVQGQYQLPSAGEQHQYVCYTPDGQKVETNVAFVQDLQGAMKVLMPPGKRIEPGPKVVSPPPPSYKAPPKIAQDSFQLPSNAKVTEDSDGPVLNIIDVRSCAPESFVNEVPEAPPAIVVEDVAETEDEDSSSMWISGEGETCFVMRLPDEDENLSDGPPVITCT